MPVTGVDHVTIAVNEIDAAVRAYEELLGSPASWRGEHRALGTEGALFALSNAAIELVAPRPEAEESEGLRLHLEERGQGLVSLAFCITDAAAWSQELRAQGLRATSPEAGEATSRDGGLRTYRSVELSPRTTRGLSLLGVERPSLDALRAPAPRSRATVDALDHVVVRSADPDAGIALYGQALGIRLALDRSFAGTRMLFFRVGGVTLELVRDATLDQLDAFYGLALRVRDIDAAHARLKALDLPLEAVREGHKPGTRVFRVKGGTCDVPTLFLQDPARDVPEGG